MYLSQNEHKYSNIITPNSLNFKIYFIYRYTQCNTNKNKTKQEMSYNTYAP